MDIPLQTPMQIQNPQIKKANHEPIQHNSNAVQSGMSSIRKSNESDNSVHSIDANVLETGKKYKGEISEIQKRKESHKLYFKSMCTVFTGQEEREDIIGHAEVKNVIENAFLLMTQLKTPLKHHIINKNVLLAGLGGLGKTHMLSNIAIDVAKLIKQNVTFYNIKTGDILSKYVGESSQLISALFDAIEEDQPSLALFDEVDSLMSKRESNESDSSRQVKTTLLSEIRGGRPLRQVMIVATTNTSKDLDASFLNRFPLKFLVRVPDDKERADLFKKNLDDFSEEVRPKLTEAQYQELAKHTEGYTGLDIRTVLGMVASRCAQFGIGNKKYFTTNLDSHREFLEKQKSSIEITLAQVTQEILLAAISDVPPSISADQLIELYDWASRHVARSRII